MNQPAFVSKTYHDENGRPVQATIVIREVPDNNFEKVFITELLAQIMAAETESLPVKSMKRILFALGHIIQMAHREDNRIYARLVDFSAVLGMSVPSVRKYLASFEALNFITKVSYGIWELNSDLFSAVSAGDRRDLVVQYRAVKETRAAKRARQKRLKEATAGQADIEFDDPRQMSIEDVITPADVVPIPTGVMPGVAAHA